MAHPFDLFTGLQVGQRLGRLPSQQPERRAGWACIQTAEFQNARTAQTIGHWCCHELPCIDHRGAFGLAGGILEGDVIAALAFQRDVLAKLFQQPRRKGPAGNDGPVAVNHAISRRNLRDLAVGQGKVRNLGPPHLSAHGNEIFGQCRDIAAGVKHMAMPFQYSQTADVWSVCGIKLGNFNAFDQFRDKAMRFLDVPVIRPRVEFRAIGVGIDVLSTRKEATRRQTLGQGAMLIGAVRHQGRKGLNDVAYTTVTGVGQKTQQPRGQTRQIGPAQK